MARQDSALWKQLFDTADRTLGPKLTELARSENFAILTGLVARAQREVASRTEQSSRRLLHMLNLPAGSDVNRLLGQIGQLERQVRELNKQLEDQTLEASVAANGNRKVVGNGVRRQSRVGSQQDSS